MTKCQECGAEGAENYKSQIDKIICNACFDKDYYFDPLSKTKTGRKYMHICDELNRIEDYIRLVIKEPEKFNDMLALTNLLTMIISLRRSIYNPSKAMKIPYGKALINIDLNDLLIKKRKSPYIFTCKWCGQEFKKHPVNKSHLPKFCSQACYKKSLHEVINVSLLDKTAKLLEKISPEDMQLFETLKGVANSDST